MLFSVKDTGYGISPDFLEKFSTPMSNKIAITTQNTTEVV